VASALRGQDLRPHSVMMTVDVQAPCAHPNSVFILRPDIKTGQLRLDAQVVALVDLGQDRGPVDLNPAVSLLPHLLKVDARRRTARRLVKSAYFDSGVEPTATK
jgi:hypothetical protein